MLLRVINDSPVFGGSTRAFNQRVQSLIATIRADARSTSRPTEMRQEAECHFHFLLADKVRAMETMHSRWIEVGSSRPETGVELFNAGLADALSRQLEFSEEEFARFGEIRGLCEDCFIKANDRVATKLTREYRYYQRAELFTQLPRFQEVPSGWLVEVHITLHQTLTRENVGQMLAISHRWENPETPDAYGAQLRGIQQYLRRNPKVKYLWCAR